ncbi:hypothetical protein M8C21_009888 [Ambrosia artemisiifolia]|uniref:Uncharacterized protein n=1 Tax=Ambrosia artemisiifolia TaxID=4212 RepID=A0AAD5D8V4_AMBAR|nr:hypothetical protein M8C21_009888 [Ambrosia artemisiifolia]
MCEVCEQAPASITCKADAATLCVTCDRDIHSANPLARRHERFPVVPFYDPETEAAKFGGGGEMNDQHYLLDFDVNVAVEAEAASWLLPNPNPNLNPKFNKTADASEVDDLKVTEPDSNYLRSCSVEGLPAYDIDYAGSKPFMYNFTSQSISQTVSSSSLEIDVGLVPGHTGATTDVPNHHHESSSEVYPTPLIGVDREARVLRYKEKRKNRKFEKTIRYASRKAYAETRPRIKGRFAKRMEVDVEAGDVFVSPECLYGVVPTY